MNKNSAFLSFKAIKIAFEYNASLFKKKEKKKEKLTCPFRP